MIDLDVFPRTPERARSPTRSNQHPFFLCSARKALSLGVKLEDDEVLFQRTASMVFPTAEDAKEAADKGATVDDHTFILKWGGAFLQWYPKVIVWGILCYVFARYLRFSCFF